MISNIRSKNLWFSTLKFSTRKFRACISVCQRCSRNRLAERLVLVSKMQIHHTIDIHVLLADQAVNLEAIAANNVERKKMVD